MIIKGFFPDEWEIYDGIEYICFPCVIKNEKDAQLKWGLKYHKVEIIIKEELDDKSRSAS